MFTTRSSSSACTTRVRKKKKRQRKKKGVRKKKIFRVLIFFFSCFFVCLLDKERKRRRSRHILRNSIHKTHLTYNSLIKNVFCAHRKLTGRLERAQRGARGRLRQRGHVLECVLFSSFSFSLFKSAFVMMRMNFCGKEEKKSSSSSSSKSMILSLG